MNRLDYLLQAVERCLRLPYGERKEELSDRDLELMSTLLAHYREYGSLRTVQEITHLIVDQWPHTSNLGGLILEWAQEQKRVLERRPGSSAAGTGTSPQQAAQTAAAESVAEAGSWSSSEPDVEDLWDWDLDEVEVEPALLDNRYLMSTATIGFVDVAPATAAIDLKEFLKLGALNHRVKDDALTPQRVDAWESEADRAATSEAVDFESQLQILAAKRTRPTKSLRELRAAPKTTVTCRLLNGTLESALAQIANSDDHDYFNMLVVGTAQFERAAVFCADSRIQELVMPVGGLGRYRHARGYLVGMMPALPFTRPIPPSAVERGRWGRRIFASLAPVEDDLMWRSVIVDQNPQGQWYFEEYGARRSWEETDAYRKNAPEKRLTVAMVERYCQIHLLRPWNEGYYRGPIFHLRAPRHVLD